MTDTSPNTGIIYRHNSRTNTHEFHVWDMRPASIDQWVDCLKDIQERALQSDQPVCCLYFIYGVWPTPYAIKRIVDLSRQSPPSLNLASAIIPISCTEEIILMIEGTLRQLPTYSRYKRQIFLFTGEATDWLNEVRESGA